MPTLYDNFERVRQYIDQHQGGGGDMSAYVTKNELSAQSYLTAVPAEYITDAELSACGYVSGAEISQMGYLTSIPSTYASYNGVYSYLHSIGIDKKSNGGCYIDSADITDSELSGDISINGVSTWELPTYAAISNMGYLTSIPSEYVTDTELSSTLGDYYTQGEVDNEIISSLRFYYTKTEINNASYATTADISGKADKSDLRSYLSVSNWTTGDYDIQLRKTGLTFISTNHTIAPATIAYEYIDASSYTNAWIGLNTLKNYVEGRLAEIEASYVTSSDLPVINENIIPKETVTYTLGDSSHLYSNSYIADMWTGAKNKFSNRSDNQVNLMLNNGWKYTFHSNGLSPATNNQDLGNSFPWRSTYTTNLYTNTAYLQDTSYTKSIVPTENNAYTLGDVDHLYDTTYTSKIQGLGTGLGIRLGNAGRYAFYDGAFRATDSNRNLGSSQYKWAATYTANLYADTIHNFIWTGTSAEYAALSDYTTYQIYMIKEA